MEVLCSHFLHIYKPTHGALICILANWKMSMLTFYSTFPRIQHTTYAYFQRLQVASALEHLFSVCAYFFFVLLTISSLTSLSFGTYRLVPSLYLRACDAVGISTICSASPPPDDGDGRWSRNARNISFRGNKMCNGFLDRQFTIAEYAGGGGGVFIFMKNVLNFNIWTIDLYRRKFN